MSISCCMPGADGQTETTILLPERSESSSTNASRENLIGYLSLAGGTGAAFGSIILYPVVRVAMHGISDSSLLVILGLFVGSLACIAGSVPAWRKAANLDLPSLSAKSIVAMTATALGGIAGGLMSTAGLRMWIAGGSFF